MYKMLASIRKLFKKPGCIKFLDGLPVWDNELKDYIVKIKSSSGNKSALMLSAAIIDKKFIKRLCSADALVLGWYSHKANYSSQFLRSE